MNIRFFLALISFLSINALGLTEQRNSCWDGTFVYRVSSINIEGENVEIGVKGDLYLFNMINDIYDKSGLNLDSADELLMAFEAKDCSEGIDGEISCWVQSQDLFPLKSSLLAKRYIDHLDVMQEIYTPVPVYGLSVKISSAHFHADFYTEDGEQKPRALIDFPTHLCDATGWYGGTNFGTVYFIDDVRDYFAKNRP